MKLLIEFDIDADIIEVPKFVIDQRQSLKSRFWKWISDKSIKHKYWVKLGKDCGSCYYGLQYRADAFVEWLNKKYIKNDSEKAYVVEEHVNIDDFHHTLPSIFF